MKQFFTLRKSNAKGFTLVELMIVVAIIGILAAIAIPQFAQYRKRGYVSTLNSDAKNAFTAMAALIADNSALNVAGIDISPNLTDAGYTQSAGVTTTFIRKTSLDDYVIQAAQTASWGLSNNATIDQDGVLNAATP